MSPISHIIWISYIHIIALPSDGTYLQAISYRAAQDLGTEITFFFDANRSPLPQFINAKHTALDNTHFFLKV